MMGKMGVMERKEGGEKEEAGPATMTSRAVNVGMSDGWVERWDGSELRMWVARRDLPQ